MEDIYFENYFDLFIHPGWKQFMEDNEAVYATLNLADAKDWNDHLAIKAEMDIRGMILDFEASIKHAYEVEQEEDSLDEEDV